MNPPLEWFLGGSLVLIMTEYGVRSRAAAIKGLTGGRRWSSALIRWALWIIIGLLERILVFVLVIAGSLASVGFIVAFKSAARFPQFKDTDFAEYFLIGTLTSIGLATLLGLLIGAVV
jgi:hypothetical protein